MYLVKFLELYDRTYVVVKIRGYTDDNLAAAARAKWQRKGLRRASVEKIIMG